MATEVYSDIKLDFFIDPKTKDLAKSIDIEAVKNAIRNVLLTRKMERRMLPEFGASLEQLLFEPIDETTAKRIGKIIIEELTFWEPRVTVSQVSVIPDEDNMRYDITLFYSVQSSKISKDNIQFTLSA